MKRKDKAQLNVKIDPRLLVSLKAEAIKSGKTLTNYITDLLEQNSKPKKSEDYELLEARLLRVEKQLDLKSTKEIEPNETIFSDSGAKKYGDMARQLFEHHRKAKNLSLKDAFAELSVCLSHYDSRPELVFQLLSGEQDLTGKKMTEAYRVGSCGLRSALCEWINDDLEPLNDAFLSAVEIKQLV
tara:strand:- start:34 stop:588 length:555 start_codon:yes stop_codon:yes gene_type:complete